MAHGHKFLCSFTLHMREHQAGHEALYVSGSTGKPHPHDGGEWRGLEVKHCGGRAWVKVIGTHTELVCNGDWG